jgi:SAM-dependent methyltransferase
MTLRLPWWARIGAKLVLSRLPLSYSLWRKFGLFRHGSMDAPDYALRVFNHHTDKVGLKNDLSGRVLLELGPGDSIATAVIASAHGAKAILVDAGHFVHNDVGPYLELFSVLADTAVNKINVSECGSIDDILDMCRSRYLTDGLESLREIEDESVDLIFSQAVLEHIRKDKFLETMRECSRILKPSGICSHQVDLRDHIGGGLNNLRFSEKYWESPAFTKSGFYTNRIQMHAMISLFSMAGFESAVSNVICWNKLPTPKTSLSSEFRDLSDAELMVSSFDVVLRKKCLK